MELIVRIVPEEDKSHFPTECNECGWIGSSKDAGGGGQIADTGDYHDICCPCCHSKDMEDADNEQPLTSYIGRLKKATDMVKKLTSEVGDLDIAVYNYTYFEQENKAMAKELYELKNKQL
jgi:hypothetical protein